MSFLLVFVLILVSGCFSSTPQAPPPAKVGFWVQNKQDNAVFVEVPDLCTRLGPKAELYRSQQQAFSLPSKR